MNKMIISEQLEELKRNDLFREIKTATFLDANKIKVQGKEVTLFCNNDYLGLSQHPKVKEAFIKAAEHYGVGAGAARLISGSTEAHKKLEEALARLKQKEKAVVFSSGYLANVGVLSSIATSEDLIVMDKLCHASLIDGAKLSEADFRVFPHLNYDRCEALLKIKRNEYKNIFLVTESIFSMDGDQADLEKLIEIKKKFKAVLIVDDAHGTGVLGKRGTGAHEGIIQAKEIDLIVGTLSKALGCLGGYVAGSEEWISFFVNRARSFIFATALPSAVCAAALQAIKILLEDNSLKKTLWENANHLHQGLKKRHFDVPALESAIIPIIVGSEKKALKMMELLFSAGYWVPAIRYPTVAKNKARLRVTVNALHKAGQIDDILAVFDKIKNV